MFIIDDLFLACVLTLVVIILLHFSKLCIGFILMLFSCYTDKDVTGGASKVENKKDQYEKKEQITSKENYNDVLLKMSKSLNKLYYPLVNYKPLKYSGSLSKLERDEKYIKMAIDIYKSENQDYSLFNIDLYAIIDIPVIVIIYVILICFQ